MSNLSTRPDLSLKGLELFQICARHGSLQATAQEAGLSISTVSHHLRNLEDQLGVALFDHARKPMVLTPKGQAFLRRIDQALHTIRRARAEASAGDIADASYLRIGAIEDFENDVMPDLAVHLSEQMPNCDFLYHTASSREILRMLKSRALDLGVITRPPERLDDLSERPLLRDPFVAVVPENVSLAAVVAEEAKLPFLQFSNDLIIAGQIEAQMRRLGVALPRKFECASNQTLMAMVAANAGWTITTPLLFSRARRFHAQVQMHPFPGKQFSRTLSLIATPDCSHAVFEATYGKIRDALEQHIVQPLCQSAPWLQDQFALLD